MARVVNIDRCFEKFDDTYSPKIIGELNGQSVMGKLLLFEPAGISHTGSVKADITKARFDRPDV